VTSNALVIDTGYAWLRLAASVLLTTVGCAGMYVCMVAVPAYQLDFSITRMDASLPFTFVMLGFGVGSLVMGGIVDRFGIVLPLAISSLFLAGAFFLAARLESFAAFALVHLMIGAFGCAAVFSPLLADISRWFVRYRGFAIAVCASGNYIAGTVWPPMIGTMISTIGWRSMYESFALLSILLMAPLLLALRRKPPAHDDEPFGGGSRGSASSLGLTPNQLTTTLSFAGVACCTAMAMPQAHVVALAVDLGLSVAEGAGMLSLMFGCGVVSRLVFGWLSDRIGGLATLLLSSSLQFLALLMFLPAQGPTLLYVAAALFGLFQGGIVPCYALIVREYFPASQAGARTGIIVFATLLGMAFGGWASGALYDMTGSYDAAFIHGAGWNLVNMVIVGMLLMRARRYILLRPGRAQSA